jgi:chondroitin-sulfate-ABC endolyase/exolyase
LTAWIDHGKAPNDASYEYMLVVRSTPEAMRKLAAKPPYQILQRDEAAHIVWNIKDRRWGCVFFAPQEVTSHAVAKQTLPIKAVDRPCLVMAEEVRNGQLEMSVADPDLNIEDHVSRPKPLRITLRGTWRLLEANGTVCVWPLTDTKKKVRIVSSSAAETVVEIVCQHGASYDLKLAR